MADRRMLTRKVTDDDRFTSLSSSAQALYLHLSMNADDDGFNNQVSVAMFKAHASVQDLEALLQKRYIYQFDDGVIVIKHWRMANALRKDRYTQTTFKEDLEKLKLDENGAYTMASSHQIFSENDCSSSSVAVWLPDGCQTVATDKIRLDKNSIDKNRLGNNPPIIPHDGGEAVNAYSDEFEFFWSVYPKKTGKKEAYKAFKRAKVNVHTLVDALEQQKQSEQWQRENGRYIPNPATWLNQGRWDDELPEKSEYNLGKTASMLKDYKEMIDNLDLEG